MDPHLLASFWAAALGYEVEDNSPLIRRLLDAGAVGPADVIEVDGRLAFRAAVAIRDRAQTGSRFAWFPFGFIWKESDIFTEVGPGNPREPRTE